MRFGNGRDGLNIGPGETTDVTCSDLGRGTGTPFPEKKDPGLHIPRNACQKHRRKAC
jgi:hypothetical protein